MPEATPTAAHIFWPPPLRGLNFMTGTNKNCFFGGLRVD